MFCLTVWKYFTLFPIQFKEFPMMCEIIVISKALSSDCVVLLNVFTVFLNYLLSLFATFVRKWTFSTKSQILNNLTLVLSLCREILCTKSSLTWDMIAFTSWSNCSSMSVAFTDIADKSEKKKKRAYQYFLFFYGGHIVTQSLKMFYMTASDGWI